MFGIAYVLIAAGVLQVTRPRATPATPSVRAFIRSRRASLIAWTLVAGWLAVNYSGSFLLLNLLRWAAVWLYFLAVLSVYVLIWFKWGTRTAAILLVIQWALGLVMRHVGFAFNGS